MAAPRAISTLWQWLWDTVRDFLDDSALAQAATIAFYALLSMAPLLVIAIAIAGAVWGADAARTQIIGQFGGLMGEDAGKAIDEAVKNAGEQKSQGVLATSFGVVILIVGAMGVFGRIKAALNTIWEVEAKPGRGIGGIIRDNLLSFAMVMCIAFLLLVSLAVSAALAALGGWIERVIAMPPAATWTLNFVVSIAIIALLFAAMYKVLPDAKIAWRDIWIGAVTTSLLFNLGKFAIGYYLGRSSTVSVYGAGASLMLILLWVYYSSIIFLFGAEFTQVYARWSGSQIEPAAHAQRTDVCATDGLTRKSPAKGRRRTSHPQAAR
jgi:membrane protein